MPQHNPKPPSTFAAATVIGILIIAGLFGASINTMLPVVVLAVTSIAIWWTTRYYNKRLPRTAAFIAYFIPLITYPVIYEPVHIMMADINPDIVDAQLVAIDNALFGASPILALHSISFPALTDFSYLAYFSYYFGMPVLLIIMFFKDTQRDFEKVLLVMTLGWYGALISYLVFPALGPHRFLGGELPSLVGALPTTSWIQGFLSASLIPQLRDCVPSMHTAITILTLVYSWQYHRRFFSIYLIPGLGLIFATMYTQQHYVIDVILGVCTAAFLYLTVETAYRRHQELQQPAPVLND